MPDSTYNRSFAQFAANNNIRMLGTDVAPTFCARDITRFLDKVSEPHQFRVEGKLGLYLDLEGLKRVLSKSRKPNAEVLAKELGMEIINPDYIINKEMLFRIITGGFPDQSFKYQHVIGPFQVDIYFDVLNVVVEFDESHHSTIPQIASDNIRETFLIEATHCEIIKCKVSDIGLIHTMIRMNEIISARSL